MSELAQDNDDAALAWLFTGAHKFPLPTAEEEQATDLKKWLALKQTRAGWLA